MLDLKRESKFKLEIIEREKPNGFEKEYIEFVSLLLPENINQ